MTTMRKTIVLLVIFYEVLAIPAQEDALQEFIEGSRKFTASVYKELLKVEKGNFVLSPFSATSILALTQEGARGDTAQQLITGLHLPSTTKRIETAFQQFLPKLKSANLEGVQLSSANKIYVADNVKLENSFNRLAANIYEAGVENINFRQKVPAANTINQWVEGRTNHRIKNLIDSDSLDADTALVLVNALYFKGKWMNQFETYATIKRPFYRSANKSSEVNMMQQVNIFNYYENKELNAKFLELQYEGSDVSLVVVLPNEINGLGRLEQNIEEVLKPQPFTRERVEVQLPKFTIETKINLVPILQNLGVTKIFDEKEADLSGLSATHKNLVVSQVLQKAFIDVNEAGTEAAAATAVSAVLLTIDNPADLSFVADHPFVYYIKLGDVILFCGKIRKLGHVRNTPLMAPTTSTTKSPYRVRTNKPYWVWDG